MIYRINIKQDYSRIVLDCKSKERANIVFDMLDYFDDIEISIQRVQEDDDKE